MIGTTLSHYEITAKLGAGGMGEVYRAHDTKLDREIALKVLPAALADDPDRLARFEREARTLAALDHPNIVHVYSVESAAVVGSRAAATAEGAGGEVGSDGRPEEETGPQQVHFMTMQLVEGRPLSALIPDGGLGLERIFELALPLAEGLAAAHEKGVVHRDLKPDNVMVTDEGRVKVLDFGLAKLARQTAAIEASETPTEALTAEGKILGTMPYMSPEQLEGNELDARSDIFSLGILLYEMATGRRPFQGDTSVSLISSIVKDTPPSVDTVRAELPHHLARIVNRCLEKDPRRRYQTATDVHTELDVLRREVESGVVPSGITRPTSAEREAARPAPVERPSRGLRSWPVAAAAAIVLIVAVAFWFARDRGAQTDAAQAGAELSTVTADRTPAIDSGLPAIVVLPFQNRGAAEDEYFADGMSEEITTRLAGVSGLRVVSSTSAMQYKENRPPIKQIAAELDVDYVLDGSVRWARGDDGSRVRITPQLVRTDDDTQVWAESYDRVIDDVFEMQSKIASEVVAQLGITLLEPEREELEARPTDNLEAYQAFLRGNFGQASADFSESTRRRIVEDYQTAVDLDPGFALAWASLAHAHAFYYRLGYDLTPRRQAMAREAFDRALSLDPTSPDVLAETGYYHYYVEHDLDAALSNFLAASDARPNDAEIMAAAAYIWRRQGKFAEGVARLERALELSPRNSQIAAHIGEYAQQMRDYPKAVRYFDIAIGLAPEEQWTYVQKAQTILLWKGDAAEARGILESILGDGEPYEYARATLTEVVRFQRHYEELISMLKESSEEWNDSQLESTPKSLAIAEALALKGDAEKAAVEYAAARAEIEAALGERPDDYRLYSSLGLALAGLGLREPAIAAGKKAIEMMPYETDAYIGQHFLTDLALIYARLGDADAALDQIDHVLSIPVKFSVAMLEIDPLWDGLRDHPRYQEIVEKYS